MLNNNNLQDLYPLSPLQSGLLFQALYAPTSDAYFVQSIFELAGEVDVQALESAWQRISDHHPILRTGFVWQDGEEPEQYVLESVCVPFTYYDWREFNSEKIQQEKLEEFIQEDRRKGFDLSQAPLFRITLIQCTKNQHYLIWSQHHILTDGWSLPIILEDLFKTYECLKQGKEPQLKSPRPYKDYIAWLQQQDMAEAEEFWKTYLASINEVPRLSFKDIIEKDSEKNYDRYSFELSEEETESLRKFAQDHSLTLNTVLQGAIGFVLKTYTQQAEIMIGVTLSGRTIDLPGIEDMVGLFINTLPLRIRIEPEESILSFLSKLQEQTQKLNDYVHTPLAQVQSWSGVNQRLFDVTFAFQNYPIEENTASSNMSFKLTNIRGIHKTEYPLTILIGPGKQLFIKFLYQTEHFDEENIRKFSNHIKQVLKHIAKLQRTYKLTNYDSPIHALSLLTSPERHQILIEWNDTKASYPADKTIYQLFEEQAEKTPDNIAVVYEDQRLTYQQLNEKANQLAHYLRSLGVTADTLVAIAVERSLEMIVGILGILKAGGAYVPLDPDYPSERLHFMLEDTNAPIILTDSNTLDKVPTTWARTICVDEEMNYIETFSFFNPLPLTLSHHLAYVIYTSGSTGKPKGVMIEHKSVINYYNSISKLITSADPLKFLHLSTFAADLGNTSLYSSLLKGHTLHILADKSVLDPKAFLNYVVHNNINFIKITPSHFEFFLSSLDAYKFNDLYLFVGGEILNTSSVLNKENMKIFNHYGPTEATVGCSVFKIDQLEQISQLSIPLGRPISNTQIYILDEYLNPIPIGVSGEIYIGGAGLARGYLKRPDLTAEKFVPNPFINEEALKESKNLRLYRTGDLARYLPDGNIEFMGRIDDQVKIRGFRIELGEIEATLARHGDISQAVVVAREDEPGHKQLVAYVVPQEEILSSLNKEIFFTSSSEQTFAMLQGETVPSSVESLRNYLAQSLPEYMIPSFFVFIDKIPLTPNGKIDRKALPAPDLSLRQLAEEYTSPQTPLEHDLHAVWTEVLKIDNIGIHDNFFKLGGHSLLATQIVSRIRHIYNIDLPLRALFEHPTIHTLSQDIEQLTMKNALSVIPPIVVQQRPETLPLSFAQQRLWFLDQLLPQASLYNVPSALRLIGPLNLNAFEAAFNFLIDRHESLRTIFPAVGGEAQQLILPYSPLNISDYLIDLCSLAPEDQDVAVQTLSSQEVNGPFILNSGPLMRLKLLKLSSQNHVFLLTMHHIITDGWSRGIFFKEFAFLYNAYALNQEPTLPPLPLQYVDFALWQRQWLQGEVLETQLSYWKQQLSDIPDLLDLPIDKPRPKELSYKGDFYSYTLSKEIKDQLNQLSQQQGTSLFMTLLALFQILLYRYSGQKNIVVGSPIANRHYKEIENLIGFFVNTLALKTNFEGDESFLDVLNKVKETTLQAYQHQDVPFEQLVEHLNITRTLNRNPVFQVMFFLQNAKTEREDLSLQDIQISPVFTDYPIAKFDLSVGAFEHEEGINIGFEYATDLFEEETIRRFGTHFEELIKQALKNPSDSIHTLPLLTLSEQHQILVEWNDTKAPYPADKTVHQLFEKQVEKTPDNIAVVYEDQELTYQQLNEKANQLAHYLRSLGVIADTLVAIAVERSLEMLIGILGILKAGGAYVPLDPDYPPERLRFMLEDTQAPILITQSHLQAKLKGMLSSYPGEIVIINNLEKTLQQQSTLNPLPLTLSHHLAYVIYTSGSTGKPKGVMIEHASLSNHMVWMKEEYSFSYRDKILQRTAYSFDASVWEVFMPLLYGAQLIITPSDINKTPAILTDIILRKGITKLQLVPIMSKNIFNNKNLKIDKIKKLFIGGDALFTENVNALPYKLQSKIINLYGPTEATIDAVSYSYNPKENRSVIPIGRPISNTQIYILDEYLNPVPIGVSGEIYIGGAGLARGYLKRPDLTAEKFVPNPFINEEALKESKNLRLYRTGDLARYLPDGNIEFMGRIDDQVKIRGFRIELGEIESTLTRHGDISQAVVVAREDEPGHKQLVAYVVPQEEILSSLNKEIFFTSSSEQTFAMLQGETVPSSVESLRNYLAQSLPEYMIPSFFVFIDKIPLTPNGKIDRKALPAPDLSLRQLAEEYTSPQTPLEHDLHAVWSEVLKIDNIGIHDNFFKLGGDSIISIQLVAKARQRGIYLAVKDIFTHPTIAALASIDQSQQNLLTLKPDQNFVQGPISLTPIQCWFFEQEFANKDHYNQATLLQLDKQVEPSLLHQAFELLIKHHDALRCRYIQEFTKIWKQENLKNEDATSIWTTLDFTHISDKELPFQIKQEANLLHQSLNIERGPLIKIALFDCGPERPARLLIVIHHLVIDGVSWRILLEDLEHVYDALKDNKTPSLPSKSHSYQQWGQALISYAQTEEIKKEIPYWQTINQSSQPLPIEFDKGPYTRFHTHTLTATLTKEETTALLQKVPKAYRTQINDILLTALTLAIGDWTGDYSLSLILEGHGREDIIPGIDLSRTVGWFTSIFPVYLKINKPDDLEDSIKTVKETLRQIPHKGIGYGILKYLTKENQLSSSLQPNLSFNYLGQWDNTLSQGGLFEFGQESAGNSISLDNTMPCPLNINCKIREGIFQVFWSYSTQHYQKRTLQSLTDFFIQKLQSIIVHSLNHQPSKYNYSDFKLTCRKNSPKFTRTLPLDLIKKITVPFYNKNHKASMFFIHPIGGEVAWYKHIADNISSHFDSYGIQSLFMENDDFWPTTIEEMALFYIQAILTIQKEGPYIIAGWSFGGKVAYEISKQMINLGYDIKATIILDETTNLKKKQVNQYIFESDFSKSLLKHNKEILCKYNHFKLINKYKIKDKVNHIIVFKSEHNEARTRRKKCGWLKYSNKTSYWVIGKDHYDIVSISNSAKISQKILKLLL